MFERLKQFGLNQFCFHTANDDVISDNKFRAYYENYSEPLVDVDLFFAGGLNPTRTKNLKYLNPDVWIVGSYITKSINFVEAVTKIRKTIYEK
ncbi:MAG: hypothetical protein QF560_04665 [SAR324 cluster bacterium]|jgi:3-hexulose-6-phosphate synthase|nr:hypothetical protein [Bacteroidota bacterium]MBP42935.1 hypothetical protein [Deltaproteobacteria bacterium]MDP6092138.1 hypothetical protein [SAR324 cluster bacterium]MBP43048.1 hypothetical protein [Deltaproteobacteria bacterium]MDP6463948.1 hypothetical protein [SAR324 cluster bacterium]|tara:strand:- start:947 stop:1225 length:279 start_codon:yes stop_codon:yes gene_type:complete